MHNSEGAFAVAAVALAGLAFALTPLAHRLDNALLDAQWRILKRFDARPAPDDIVIVGIDEATVGAITEPPALWHMPLGTALARIASARPRAIALDHPLPERSYDAIKPGLDRALFDGLATAVEAVPVVAPLNIDPRTRAARLIHKPYLALLGESRLGLALAALLVLGSLPAFVGLAVALPLLGHATWHLYRRVVEPDPNPPQEQFHPRKGHRYAADFPAVLFPWSREREP